MLTDQLSYQEESVIHLPAGLIGMPDLRRFVLVRQTDIEPLLWLASVDRPDSLFLVIRPQEVEPEYRIELPEEALGQLGLASGEWRAEEMTVLAVVKVTAEWSASTVNLRAPIIINPETMRGCQILLTEPSYEFTHPLLAGEQSAEQNSLSEGDAPE